MLMIENNDKYVEEMEKAFEMNNENLPSLSKITLSYVHKCLSEEVYVPEIGDSLIKLSIQFSVRYLNFITDQVKEKKTMGTERILIILDDLFKHQESLKTETARLISKRLN